MSRPTVVSRFYARHVVLALHSSESGLTTAGDETEDLNLIRCHVAINAWTKLHRFHVANWESQHTWPYAIKYALASAIIALDDSKVAPVVADAKRLEEFRPVFLSAVRIALKLKSPQEVEGHSSVRLVLRGELREPWVAMLIDHGHSAYAVEVLQDVDPQRMSVLEREVYAQALMDVDKFEKARGFLFLWPDPASCAREAYLSRDIARAVALYEEMEASDNVRWRTMAHDAFELPAIRMVRAKRKASGLVSQSGSVDTSSPGFYALWLAYWIKRSYLQLVSVLRRSVSSALSTIVVRVD